MFPLVYISYVLVCKYVLRGVFLNLAACFRCLLGNIGMIFSFIDLIIDVFNLFVYVCELFLSLFCVV